MDNYFVGYKNIERELKDRFLREEIGVYDYETNMKHLSKLHNKEGERLIFRITKASNGRIHVDYSSNK